jgi:hypothetical protein
MLPAVKKKGRITLPRPGQGALGGSAQGAGKEAMAFFPHELFRYPAEKPGKGPVDKSDPEFPVCNHQAIGESFKNLLPVHGVSHLVVAHFFR